MLLEFGAKVTRTVITLKEKTYYADLTVTLGGRTYIFDSRSSDAIALAVLFKAPIIVNKQTWDSAGQPLSEPKQVASCSSAPSRCRPWGATAQSSAIRRPSRP